MQHNLAQRRDTRLTGWNYRLPGPYAITLCTQHREWRFGDIKDGYMHLSQAGKMVERVWLDMPVEFPLVTLDAFVVMPNHLHAIVLLDAGSIDINPELGTVVQRFKAVTTACYARGVHEHGWKPFDRRLWQRNYYDHIVRDDRDLDRCGHYIEVNPSRWHEDRDHDPSRNS